MHFQYSFGGTKNRKGIRRCPSLPFQKVNSFMLIFFSMMFCVYFASMLACQADIIDQVELRKKKTICLKLNDCLNTTGFMGELILCMDNYGHTVTHELVFAYLVKDKNTAAISIYPSAFRWIPSKLYVSHVGDTNRRSFTIGQEHRGGQRCSTTSAILH